MQAVAGENHFRKWGKRGWFFSVSGGSEDFRRQGGEVEDGCGSAELAINALEFRHDFAGVAARAVGAGD